MYTPPPNHPMRSRWEFLNKYQGTQNMGQDLAFLIDSEVGKAKANTPLLLAMAILVGSILTLSPFIVIQLWFN